MGWMSRYGKWQDDINPRPPAPIETRHWIFAVICVSLLLCLVASFPLTVHHIPQPQLTEYMPKGLHCATCAEIWVENRDLFNREGMHCYGPPAYDRPTRKDEEVMYTEEKRCWVVEKGHDTWMRPLKAKMHEFDEAQVDEMEAQKEGIEAQKEQVEAQEEEVKAQKDEIETESIVLRVLRGGQWPRG